MNNFTFFLTSPFCRTQNWRENMTAASFRLTATTDEPLEMKYDIAFAAK
jgi:hypothetical protein